MGIQRRAFLKSLAGSAALATMGMGFTAPTHAKARPDITELQLSRDDDSYWQLLRRFFPLAAEKIYFNNGGLGPSPYPVIDTLNAKTLALEIEGEHGHEMVEAVNQKAAQFLNASPHEIAITQNTTESMNIIARGLPLKAGDEVLLSTHEHVGGAMPWLGLAKDSAIKINLFEPGLTAADNLNLIEQHLTPKTRVVSISHATCTTGLFFPVKEIARLCHARNILLVLDGAHPVGMTPVDLHDLECDFYATSGHKWLLGPKGTGLLYIRQAMFEVWKPRFIGAYSDDGSYDLFNQRLGYRPDASITQFGTRNTPLALGLGAAIDFIDAIGPARIASRGKAMANYLRNLFDSELPQLEILTPAEPASSGPIITFRPRKSDFQLVQQQLYENYKIRLRGVNENNLKAIRCSLHVYNNFQEIDLLVQALKKILAA